jgi:hypothetical protein
MSAWITALSECEGVITIKGTHNFPVLDKCQIIAHYNDAPFMQTDDTLFQDASFEIRIPFSVSGTVLLIARVSGIADVPMAIGYSSETGMRNRLGNFVLGESVVFTRAEANMINVGNANKKTLKDILEKRFNKQPPHEDVDLLKQYISIYDFVEKEKILSELA